MIPMCEGAIFTKIAIILSELFWTPTNFFQVAVERKQGISNLELMCEELLEEERVKKQKMEQKRQKKKKKKNRNGMVDVTTDAEKVSDTCEVSSSHGFSKCSTSITIIP